MNIENFNFEDIDQLSPDDFELFVMECLSLAGWKKLYKTQVGVDARYGDGGYDIEGFRGKIKWLFEVKQRSSSTVGIDALRQILHAGRNKGVKNLAIVSNNFFSSKVEDEAAKYGVELIDRNKLHSIFLEKRSDIGLSFSLRSYQKKIVDEISIKYSEEGKDKFLIEMATGLGKTITSIGVVRKMIDAMELIEPKVLFVAHQKEILKQSMHTFKKNLGITKYRYSVLFDGEEIRDTNFIFSTFQTLLTQRNQKQDDFFDIIIVDECHHIPAITFSQLSKLYSPKFLLGLSATPERTDNKSTYEYFGGTESVVGKLDLAWALKNNKLAFPKYHLLTDDISVEKLNLIRSNSSISDVDKDIFIERKDSEIVKVVEDYIHSEKIENPKGIVFCKNKKHLKNMLNYFPPGSATAVYSDMQKDDVVSNIKNFREGSFRYILTIDLFNEGIDIPEVNILVFLRKTSSKRIWLQQLGRGLRKTPIKNYVDVFDFVGSISRLKDVVELERQYNSTVQESFDPKDKKEIVYDRSLIVNFSKAAAEIEALLSRLEFKTRTRDDIVLEVLRISNSIGSKIPSPQVIAEGLSQSSLDQVLSLFGSYLNLVKYIFKDQKSLEEIELRVREEYFAVYDGFKQKFHVDASPYLLQLSTNPANFPLANIEFIKKLDLPSPGGEDGKDVGVKDFVKNANTNMDTCSKEDLIYRYSDSVNTLADISSLDESERFLIRKMFKADAIFLRELKKLKGAA